MNQAREIFQRTTEQYFQENQKTNCDINIPSENKTSEPSIKKFNIKEGPFINYKDK